MVAIMVVLGVVSELAAIPKTQNSRKRSFPFGLMRAMSLPSAYRRYAFERRACERDQPKVGEDTTLAMTYLPERLHRLILLLLVFLWLSVPHPLLLTILFFSSGGQVSRHR